MNSWAVGWGSQVSLITPLPFPFPFPFPFPRVWSGAGWIGGKMSAMCLGVLCCGLRWGRRRGAEEGTSMMDWMSDEQRRGGGRETGGERRQTYVDVTGAVPRYSHFELNEGNGGTDAPSCAGGVAAATGVFRIQFSDFTSVSTVWLQRKKKKMKTRCSLRREWKTAVCVCACFFFPSLWVCRYHFPVVSPEPAQLDWPVSNPPRKPPKAALSYRQLVYLGHFYYGAFPTQ